MESFADEIENEDEEEVEENEEEEEEIGELVICMVRLFIVQATCKKSSLIASHIHVEDVQSEVYVLDSKWRRKKMMWKTTMMMNKYKYKWMTMKKKYKKTKKTKKKEKEKEKKKQ